MKKKSILGRIGIVAAALTLATTSMMSGTLARYQTSKNITATAIIAKWDPTVTPDTGSQGQGAQSNTWLVDLASTMNTNDGSLSIPGDTIGTSGATTPNRIAPGTSGSFTITINTQSAEVPTLCDIKVKKNDSYVWPSHLTLNISDGTAGLVNDTMYPKWNAGDTSYDDAFEGQDEKVLNSKPLRFASVRENNAVTTKVLTVTWTWPLDLKDNTYAQGSAEKADDTAYNANDYGVGKAAAAAETKFGFDLEVVLKQQGKNDTDVINITK